MPNLLAQPKLPSEGGGEIPKIAKQTRTRLIRDRGLPVFGGVQALSPAWIWGDLPSFQRTNRSSDELRWRFRTSKC